MNIRSAWALLPLVLAAILVPPAGASIIGVSIPVNSCDATCHALIDNVWSTSVPPYSPGIGWILDTTVPGGFQPGEFNLHDHLYASEYTPDPARAIVTYQFDVPTIVSSLDIWEHTNGINEVEGFYGDSPGSLTSLGPAVTGTLGGGPYGEGASNIFDFGNTTLSGTYFAFIVRSTYLPNGYAAYRAFPIGTEAAVPEPGSLAMLMFGLLILSAVYRRKA